ncbi:glycosyltransferase [Lysobacter sp. GCM10012299]|uniref:glycosyltransferase family 2 protein n=1 Tax=Lysobacter sp. GCM10012299 TaxID=3317333 RepID=UPI00360C2F35
MASDAITIAEYVFIAYYAVFNLCYIILVIMSMLELRDYVKRRTHELPTDENCPSVAIVVPCYNEERVVLSSVTAMLRLDYPDHTVIVVNDGSCDRTLQVLMERFELTLCAQKVPNEVPHQAIRGVYRCRSEPKLIVIDKERGGKADALNAGLDIITAGLFCSVDGDTFLRPDSLRRLVRPFVQDAETVAVGATIRIANGVKIRGGMISRIDLPNSLLIKMQIVEYSRAFIFGRLGWSKLGATMIISGALGLFDVTSVKRVGGYRVDTVGEDMELVVRLHRWFRSQDTHYRILSLPDPIAWTEAPSDISTLARQRVRWQRGLGESLILHPPWCFGWKGGTVAFIAWPYWFAFELIGPFVQIAAIAFTLIALSSGWVSPLFVVAMLALSIGMGAIFTVMALVIDKVALRPPVTGAQMAVLILFAVFENVGFAQLNCMWQCKGTAQWFLGRKHGWGAMKRSGEWTGAAESPSASERHSQH